MVFLCDAELSVTTLPKLFVIQGKQLQLKGTINGNQNHFVCWVCNGDNWILFDGMVKGGEGTEYHFIDDKHQIENECKRHWVMAVFYEVKVESDKQEKNETKEQIHQEKQISLEHIKKDLTDFFPKQFQPKKRMKLGFYHESESPNKSGVNPKCKGCNNDIEKKDERIVHVHNPYPNKKWKKEDKYHCKLECLNCIADDKKTKFCEKKWAQEKIRKIVMAMNVE